EWTDGVDALWRDNNLNGTYQLSDTALRADAAIPQNSATNMILLQRFFVDGDGAATNGAGSDDATRTGQTSFQFSDLIYWHDVDRSKDWTTGDSLWRDNGDGVYRASIGDSVIVSAAGFTSGTIGTALSPAAHWIGYDDGEINFNGHYDDGEDITAGNSFFAYDDLEVNPNFKYDPGEDIYDRDYLEIWVYAEGENTSTLFDNNDFAPDREPALRDIGFRVHLNGNRVDDASPITSTRTISDYDAPGGVQAAAGWGPSRGYVGPAFAPPDPAYGGFNRHYEYRLPRRDGLALQAALRPFKESEHSEIIAILPDCSVLIEMTWKDVRRNSQGKFVSGSGAEYPSSSGSQLVWETWDFLHPPPLPPIPWIVKADLNDPLLPGQQVVPSLPGHGSPPPLPLSFFDVFYYNDLNQPITQLTLTGNSSTPGQMQLLSAQASSAETIIQPGSGNTFAQVMNLAPGDWVGLVVMNELLPSTLPPGSPITNTVEVTGTTPGGPLPPAPPAEDSSTFNPPITIELVKTSVPITTVMAGGLITYSVLYENLSQFPLSNVRLTDTLPISLSPLRGFPIDSFFDVFYTIDLPRPLMRQERGRFEVTASVSPSLQAGVRLTNTVRATFNAPPIMTGTKTITQSVIVSTTPGLIIPPNVITVTGPLTGEINTPYFFTATVGPIDTTTPITWVTRAGLQPPITDTTNIPIELVELSLTSSGPIPITVTASNAGGTVT
ncbi:MAG: DUF11 domain-containing protein, partial [Chloroflexi bacterium]|nr:DUF11 domain-containing protein [Chloroflexota bacterium]